MTNRKQNSYESTDASSSSSDREDGKRTSKRGVIVKESNRQRHKKEDRYIIFDLNLLKDRGRSSSQCVSPPGPLPSVCPWSNN